MLFLEAHARLLLIVHAVAAGILVGASTHHVLSCRGYLAGRFERIALERRYAVANALAFALTFLVGAALYPTYKVRVRAEYFDSPEAVEAEQVLRVERARQVGSPAPAGPSRDLSRVARAFDVKEHWAALGLGAALVLLVLGRLAHPSLDRRFAAAYFGLSLFVCAAAWAGLLLGLMAASYRAVGAVS